MYIRSITATLMFLSVTACTSTSPKVIKKWHYYTVSGTTLIEIKSSMNANGPSGYWAHSKWDIRWDPKCNVKVKLTYEFPKLKNRRKVPTKVLEKWDAMIFHLKAHEKQHMQHGIEAGNAIFNNNCENGDAIIRNWAAQDKILDEKTDHGKRTGVVLDTSN